MTRLKAFCVGVAILIIGEVARSVATIAQTGAQTASITQTGPQTTATPARRVVRRANPTYPADIVRSRVDAGSTLKVRVDAAGDVVNIEDAKWQVTVYSDSNIPDPAAFWAAKPGEAFVLASEAAAREWKFEPGDGEMVSTVSFAYRTRGGGSSISLQGGFARGAADRGPLAPMRVGGNIQPPQKIVDVKPVYPPEAQAARIMGVIILEVTIAPDGSVADAKVLRSIPMLDQPALDAVRQWKFTPTLMNGQPVPIIMTVTVNFSLQ